MAEVLGAWCGEQNLWKQNVCYSGKGREAAGRKTRQGTRGVTKDATSRDQLTRPEKQALGQQRKEFEQSAAHHRCRRTMTALLQYGKYLCALGI
jgi:hypothetical protein